MEKKHIIDFSLEITYHRTIFYQFFRYFTYQLVFISLIKNAHEIVFSLHVLFLKCYCVLSHERVNPRNQR